VSPSPPSGLQRIRVGGLWMTHVSQSLLTCFNYPFYFFILNKPWALTFHHELRIAHGLTLMIPIYHGWEAFPTAGALTHTRITWAFSYSHAMHYGKEFLDCLFSQALSFILLYPMAIPLASTLHQWQSFTPICTSKGLSNSVKLRSNDEYNLLLSSPKGCDKAHPTLRIIIFVF
jgi:hypothetical protein